MRNITWKLRKELRELDLEKGKSYVEKIKKKFDVKKVEILEDKIVIKINE